jgi:hypothetical protein
VRGQQSGKETTSSTYQVWAPDVQLGAQLSPGRLRVASARPHLTMSTVLLSHPCSCWKLVRSTPLSTLALARATRAAASATADSAANARILGRHGGKNLAVPLQQPVVEGVRGLLGRPRSIVRSRIVLADCFLSHPPATIGVSFRF